MYPYCNLAISNVPLQRHQNLILFLFTAPPSWGNISYLLYLLKPLILLIRSSHLIDDAISYLTRKTVANKRTSEFYYLIYSGTCIHNYITWAFIKIRKMNICSSVSSVCTFVLDWQVLLILSLVLEPE